MKKEDILRAMELSAFAYGEKQPCAEGEKLTVIDDCPSGVQCFLRQSGDRLSIAFRGTDTMQDWKTDFSFWRKKVPYDNTASKIRVHNGFISAYKSPAVRDRIQRHVTKEIRRIHICGHSFGAALTILCAVDLQYCYPDRDIEAVAFGCPRVGNAAFQKSYDKRVIKTLRVENGNDIVTKIPFASWGYRHVGGRLHIGPPRIFGLLSPSQHRPLNYYGALLERML